MTSDELAFGIKSLLEFVQDDEDVREDHGLPDEFETARIRTFDEVGMLTRDAGLVVKLSDGRTFQVTVIQSR